jgi:RimJ/RimL family protein N-acetyltransferase
MERLGMMREACFQEIVREGGCWRDVLVYGLPAKEWTKE